MTPTDSAIVGRRNSFRGSGQQMTVSDNLKHIKDAIRMKRETGGDRFFITIGDLREIWRKHLRKLLGTWSYDVEQIKKVSDNYIIVLSILVWMSLPNTASALREFLERGITDRRLPLDEEYPERDYPLEHFQMESFLSNQYMFKPILLVNNQDDSPAELRTYSEKYILPYIERREKIGFGASADVYKVNIKAGCVIAHENGTFKIEAENQILAVKTFNKECGTHNKEHEPRNWRNEFKNLNRIRGSLRKHAHILMHTAALIHNDCFHLFLEHTELGDLSQFFNKGWDRSSTTSKHCLRYDFDQFFPDFKSRDLLEETGNLADAIKFLHNGITVNYRKAIVAHMDLRPQNILVFPPTPANKVGRWKLCDFGISSFDTQAERTKISLHGPHRAPELSGMDKRIVSAPRCDIWSLGCIIFEVAIFAIGEGRGGRGDKDLKQFTCARASDNDGEDDYYFYNNGDEHRLKPSVLHWLNEKVRKCSDENFWPERLAPIIDLTIRCDPDGRQNANFVVNEMQAILRCINRNDSAVDTPLNREQLAVSPDLSFVEMELQHTSPQVDTSEQLSESGIVLTPDRRDDSISGLDVGQGETAPGVLRAESNPSYLVSSEISTISRNITSSTRGGSDIQRQFFQMLYQGPSRTTDLALDMILNQSSELALATNEDGCTPIMIAARRWNKNVVKKLLPFSEIHRQDCQGKTLLHYIILKDPGFPHTDSEVQSFLSDVLGKHNGETRHGTPFVHHQDDSHTSALMLCVRRRNPASTRLGLARALIEAGKSETCSQEGTRLALDEAVRKADARMAALLVEELSGSARQDFETRNPDFAHRVRDIRTAETSQNTTMRTSRPWMTRMLG